MESPSIAENVGVRNGSGIPFSNCQTAGETAPVEPHTALLADVMHLFLAIFVTGVDTGQKMAQLEAVGDINTLQRVAGSPLRNTALTEASPDLAYAFCKFDISSRPLMVEGDIPPSYWSLSVYSETGANVYTLNDRQAGVSRISAMIVEEGETFKEEARPENTIIVRSPTQTGLVLFRAFVADRSQTKLITSHLDASECRLRPVTSARK